MIRLKIIHANVASYDDEEEGTYNRIHTFKVELDSLIIGVENHASNCTTNNICHFIGHLKHISNRVVKGYG